MMKNARDFLHQHMTDDGILTHWNLRLVVMDEVNTLSNRLDEIEKKCDGLLHKNFCDMQVKFLAEKYRGDFPKDKGALT